jgi:secondary thiamine-phosphate synthase enzyme
MMTQHTSIIEQHTFGPGFYDVTEAVTRRLGSARALAGLVTLFCRHTSASLTIQENADPDVLADLGDALAKLAPRDSRYRHSMEGADDMPAHIRTLLTSTSLSIPVLDGRMTLGTWQAVYLIEHRDRPHTRQIALNFTGEAG